MQNEEEKYFDIEKVGDIKKLAEQPDIVFDNKGGMHVDNRAYRRGNRKNVWRAVIEGKPLKYFTARHHKTTKATKKRERQNRKRGRK